MEAFANWYVFIALNRQSVNYFLLETSSNEIWASFWDAIKDDDDDEDEADSEVEVPGSKKEKCLLPPKPIKTRYGTSLVTICFIGKYLTKILNYTASLKKRKLRPDLEENFYRAQTSIIEKADELLLE